MNITRRFDEPLHPLALPHRFTPPKPQPTKHTTEYVFFKRAKNLENAEKELPSEREGLSFPAWGPVWLGEPRSKDAQFSTPCTSRPAPGPLASLWAKKPSLRRSARTDSYGCSSRCHQGPTPGTSPSTPRSPKHSLRRWEWGLGEVGVYPRQCGTRRVARETDGTEGSKRRQPRLRPRQH